MSRRLSVVVGAVCCVALVAIIVGVLVIAAQTFVWIFS